MGELPLHIVTGGFGYSGRYIAERLLEFLWWKSERIHGKRAKSGAERSLKEERKLQFPIPRLNFTNPSGRALTMPVGVLRDLGGTGWQPLGSNPLLNRGQWR